MIANDVAWVAFWVIFFQEVASVRGWDVDRVLLLLAVLCTSAGLVLGLLSDARDAAMLLAASALFAALGWGTFTAGLRRYSSGSAWGRG